MRTEDTQGPASARIATRGIGIENDTVPGTTDRDALNCRHVEVDMLVGIGGGGREERASPIASRTILPVGLRTQPDGRFDEEQSANGFTKQPPQW